MIPHFPVETEESNLAKTSCDFSDPSKRGGANALPSMTSRYIFTYSEHMIQKASFLSGAFLPVPSPSRLLYQGKEDETLQYTFLLQTQSFSTPAFPISFSYSQVHRAAAAPCMGFPQQADDSSVCADHTSEALPQWKMEA